MNWQLELLRPELLWTLAVLIPVVWVFRRSLVDFSRGQRRLSLILRGLILVLLVFALAGLTLLRPTKRKWVVCVADVSRSVGMTSQERTYAFVEELRDHAGSNRVSLLPFGAEPFDVQSDFEKTAPVLPDPAALADSDDSDRVDGTDIAAALETAKASIPPSYVGEIVLLSDGNETRGDALAAAAGLGVPVSTVPMPLREEPEVQVAEVTAPTQIREGEPFYVEVVVNSNTDDQDGTITVYRGPHKVVEEKKKIARGENRFRFRQTVRGERLADFSATVAAKNDTILDDNTNRALVFTSGKPRVLLIESDPKRVRDLVWGLKEQDISVDARPPEGMPRSLADLQNYELVVLSNVPATSLNLRQMDLLKTYVRDLGGGFMMLGGEQSFGLGGYYKTPIEEILPLRSDFEKKKEKPSLAIALVIDKSGSMGGTKIEMAKEAARSTVEVLSGRDQVAVIAFDGSATVICPMTSAAARSTVEGRIASLAAGGGTSIYPAMVEANDQLVSAAAKLKHVILLTDGHSAPGDFVGITQQMTTSQITVSTVGVGGGADHALLEEIANTGNGRYYACEDAESIPQIFTKETMTAAKSAINEQPFAPQIVSPTDVFSGIDLEQAPLLLGYVVTRSKPTCEYILATETGEPLLAWWRYGLGMSVAFTSDAKNRWAAEWINWPGFPKFWAQLVRHAMRKTENREAVVSIARRGGAAAITLDASDADGRFLNEAVGTVTLLGPDGSKEELAMDSDRPGPIHGRSAGSRPGNLSSGNESEKRRKDAASAIPGRRQRIPG